MVTGTAAVGRDTNAATNESIENTTAATIALVILILVGIYRSLLLAIVPLVTIGCSVFVAAPADRVACGISGPGVSGDRHHANLCRSRVIRRRDRLLPLSGGRDYREELGHGKSQVEAAPGSGRSGRCGR